MEHYGDITKLSGYDLPIADVITGGSPCQDLSVAGKRAGLDGERSGLFMDQVRIVKEMREHDRELRQLQGGRTGFDLRPRYLIWENVPGAFSSNKGKDFQAVLTEIVKIIEPESPNVPMPEKGKWPKSGCLYDELGGWSVAWRVHDAQFWGVPQRRKRIALVADFGGLTAPEVLFIRKGLHGDSERSAEEGEGAATGTGASTKRPGALNSWDVQSKHIQPEDGIAESLYSEKRFFEWHEDDKSVTLRNKGGSYGGGSEVLVVTGDGVRRLTPKECERLQGFPDGWTDIGEWTDSKGKTHQSTDSARYKALGNSIAIPYWKSLARKICAQYDRDITMGSLFDGIGGFPYCFESVGAKAVWASEIEEFPIAVTKRRFPDEEDMG